MSGLVQQGAQPLEVDGARQRGADRDRRFSCARNMGPRAAPLARSGFYVEVQRSFGKQRLQCVLKATDDLVAGEEHCGTLDGRAVTVPRFDMGLRLGSNPGGTSHGVEPACRPLQAGGIAVDPRSVVGKSEQSSPSSAQPEDFDGQVGGRGGVVVKRGPGLLALPRIGLRTETSPDHGGTGSGRGVVGEGLCLQLKRGVEGRQTAALRDIEASARVLEVPTELLPCRASLGRALEGSKQGGVALDLREHCIHGGPRFADGAREGRGSSDGGFVLGRAQRREQAGAGCDETRDQLARCPREGDDLVLKLGLRRLDLGRQAMGALAQALGPVISRGTTH